MKVSVFSVEAEIKTAGSIAATVAVGFRD